MVFATFRHGHFAFCMVFATCGHAQKQRSTKAQKQKSREAEKQESIEPGTPKKIQNLPQKKKDLLGIYLPWSPALSLEIKLYIAESVYVHIQYIYFCIYIYIHTHRFILLYSDVFCILIWNSNEKTNRSSLLTSINHFLSNLTVPSANCHSSWR